MKKNDRKKKQLGPKFSSFTPLIAGKKDLFPCIFIYMTRFHWDNAHYREFVLNSGIHFVAIRHFYLSRTQKNPPPNHYVKLMHYYNLTLQDLSIIGEMLEETNHEYCCRPFNRSGPPLDPSAAT